VKLLGGFNEVCQLCGSVVFLSVDKKLRFFRELGGMPGVGLPTTNMPQSGSIYPLTGWTRSGRGGVFLAAIESFSYPQKMQPFRFFIYFNSF